MKDKSFSFRKRAASFKFAFNGIRLLIAKEHNARIHCFATLCVIIAGMVLDLSRLEWIAVIIVTGAVFAMEAVNTAIEILCDLMFPDYNESVKKIKDLAAAAVLLLAFSAAIVGLIVFVPKLCSLL